MEQQLFSAAPVYKSLDTVLLADSLTEMQAALGKDNADVRKVMGKWVAPDQLGVPPTTQHGPRLTRQNT